MTTGLTYDFYSPFMQATVIRDTGQRIPLWVVDQEIGATASAMALKDRPFAQEISVTLNLSGAPQITVKLTPTYEQALEYLNSTLIEGTNSVIEVLLGYSTGGRGGGPVFGPRYTGTLLRPEVQLGADISITLKGQGLGSLHINNTNNTGTLRGTKAQIIQELLRGPDPQNPTRLRADFSAIEQLSDDEEVRQAFFDDIISEPMGGRTPWQVISEYVWEALCWSVFDGQVLRIIPRSTVMLAPPKYLLSIYDFPGGLGPAENVFPILSVSSETNVYSAGALQMLTSSGTDPRSRNPDVRTYDDRTAPVTRTEDGVGRPVNTPTSPGVSPTSAQVPNGGQNISGARAEDNGASQQRAVRAEWEASQTAVGAQVSLETLGMPDIVPGEVFTLRGLGVRLDGNYASLEVTHTVGPSGYVTSMKAVKNVESQLSQGQRALGAVNRARATRRRFDLYGEFTRAYEMVARPLTERFNNLDSVAIPRLLRGL